MTVSTQDRLKMYRWMVLTRCLEEKICELLVKRNAPERQHASVGQEAIGVGVCYGLRTDDFIMPSLRTRAAFLVKGIPMKDILAAFLGKTTPQTGGKQTSHHMGDLDIGVISGSGLVGDNIPIAVGGALACKRQRTDRVVVVFFGDAATNRGDFHEGLNLAAVWKAPIIFVCENNLYGWTIPVSKHVAIDNLADRAQSYGFPGVVVDGNDVIDVYEKTRDALERARTGDGPTLLECKTYRWRGHSEREVMEYRPAEEIESWKQKCPIRRLAHKLITDGVLDETQIGQIEQEISQEIQIALDYADQMPFPEPQELLEGVYAPFESERSWQR